MLLGGVLISIYPMLFIKYFKLSNHISEADMTNIGYAVGVTGVILAFFALYRFWVMYPENWIIYLF